VGGEDHRKIFWIGWSSVCLQKEFGGLGVRQLNEFNLALLGKWCWRVLVDRGCFWYRVLVARYGEVSGRLEDGGRSCSSWWREVGRIRDGGGYDGGGWFRECVSKKVGDGTDTLFWFDRWLGLVPLCVRFRRLFELYENKYITVAELFSLGVAEGGEAWQWRRRLWAWEEEMLEECRACLFDVSLHVNVSDQWLWIPDSIEGYFVQGVYDVLTSKDLPVVDPSAELIWHRQVPLKVSVFAWRLLRDRLLTKSNLNYKGVVSPEVGLCVSGCGYLESAQHLFLYCPTFAALWPMVRDWIGFDGVDTNVLSDHFVQFVHSTGGNKIKQRRLFFSLFGSFVPRFYGLNVTIGFLIILLLRCLGCWTK